MKFIKLGTALALGATIGATAAWAEYPERAIKMVIPYGAGGATDISARTIAEPLGNAVGKPLIMAIAPVRPFPRGRGGPGFS